MGDTQSLFDGIEQSNGQVLPPMESLDSSEISRNSHHSPMQVKKISDMVYIAESEIKGDSQNYMIELLENNRRGSCTCPHFKIRILPKWRRGEDAKPCKHIIHSLGTAVYEKMNGTK